jgi:hypothetical protein
MSDDFKIMKRLHTLFHILAYILLFTVTSGHVEKNDCRLQIEVYLQAYIKVVYVGEVFCMGDNIKMYVKEVVWEGVE